MASNEQPTPDQKLTSEKRLGISPQPKETCPAINDAIAVVEQCQREMKRWERLDEAGMRDLLQSLEYGLAKLVGYNGRGMLEDLRRANSAIRDWGEEWKQKALEWEPIEETE